MSNMDAPPIWQRFRETFLYALYPTPLGLAVVIGALLVFVAGKSLLSLLLLFIGFRYTVEVFEQTAEGKLKPPGLTSEVLIENYGPTVKLLLLLIVIMFLVFSIGRSAGMLPAVISWYFFLIALPASYMTVMLTGSLLQGINPVTLIKMILIMGWSYWLLYGLLFLLSTAWENLAVLVLDVSSPTLMVFLFYVSFFVFNVVAFHMMGYMIYRRGEQFGTVSHLPYTEDSPFRLFDELMADGHHDAARVELKRIIDETPADLALYRRMHNLALVDQAIPDLVGNAAKAIPLLIANGRASEAADMFLDCARHNVMPKRLSADNVLTMARQLRSMGKPHEAFKLLNGFHKRYPHSENIFEAYLLAAQVLSEDLNRDDLAAQLLRYLDKTFHDHARIDEVHRYQQVIAALGAT